MPLFVSVEVAAPLVVPTCCDANVRVAGLMVTAGAGAVPVPVSVTL